MITRATNRDPLLHEVLHACLDDLISKLADLGLQEVHLPIVDVERPYNNLNNWYRLLVDYLADTDIYVYLHDRVYVSIASIAQFPMTIPLEDSPQVRRNNDTSQGSIDDTGPGPSPVCSAQTCSPVIENDST